MLERYDFRFVPLKLSACNEFEVLGKEGKNLCYVFTQNLVRSIKDCTLAAVEARVAESVMPVVNLGDCAGERVLIPGSLVL